MSVSERSLPRQEISEINYAPDAIEVSNASLIGANGRTRGRWGLAPQVIPYTRSLLEETVMRGSGIKSKRSKDYLCNCQREHS